MNKKILLIHFQIKILHFKFNFVTILPDFYLKFKSLLKSQNEQFRRRKRKCSLQDFFVILIMRPKCSYMVKTKTQICFHTKHGSSFLKVQWRSCSSPQKTPGGAVACLWTAKGFLPVQPSTNVWHRCNWWRVCLNLSLSSSPVGFTGLTLLQVFSNTHGKATAD